MLRIPLLPINHLLDLPTDPALQLQHYIRLAESRLLQEALQIASPSLSNNLPALSDTRNERKSRQAVTAWIRYWLRMVSRPTPFGLFAGVALGQFSQSSQLAIHSVDHYRKSARPDMEWLLRLIESLESDVRIATQLSVQTSNIVLRQGSRLVIPYVTRYGQSNIGQLQHESISVRLTPVLDMVMRTAERMIPLADLINIIKEEYKETKTDVIASFLMKLIHQEVLFTSLRPPTTVPAPLEHVIQALAPVNGIDPLKQWLSSISQTLRRYEQLPLGEGIDTLHQLQSMMSQISPSANLIQVDLSVQAHDIKLPVSVSQDVAKAADLIWRWNASIPNHNRLQSYALEFVDKYGLNREVPILELLDEEIGLGAPAGYILPESTRKVSPAQQSMSRNEHLLLHWVTKSIADQQHEIQLSERELLDWECMAQSPGKAPLSMEMYFTLMAASPQAVDEGDYKLILSPNQGSAGAGKTFGRFAWLLGTEAMNQLATVQDEESRRLPAPVMAEVSYYPIRGKSTNVVLTPNFRPYEIPVGNRSSRSPEETIELNDIVVGYSNGQLYLKSVRLQREVIATAGHMLNPVASPNLCRFMLDISQERRSTWQPFQWGAIEKSPFLPRLTYGRIVLSPARWTWNDASTIKALKNASVTEWLMLLAEWRSRWKVPRHVYLTQADQRIILDLEMVYHSNLMRQELQSHGTVTLVELGGDLLEFPVVGKNGVYVGEFVFPIIRNHLSVEDREVLPGAASRVADSNNRPSYLPGSEWLYLKIYGNGKRQDELIGRDLKTFTESLKTNRYAKLCYFVRYQDPDPHLRVRILGESPQTSSELIAMVHEWGQHLRQEGLMNRLVIDTYEPEIERYGGMNSMMAAERLFAADSEVVTAWIAKLRFEKTSIDKEKIAIISIIEMMDAFGFSLNDRFDWFNARCSQHEYLNDFRMQRKQILQLANLFVTGQQSNGWMEHPDGPFIMQTLEYRNSALLNYVQTVRQAQELHETSIPLGDALGSVIHMHLNRLLGINPEQERRVMGLTRHTLHGLIHMRKNLMTNEV